LGLAAVPVRADVRLPVEHDQHLVQPVVRAGVGAQSGPPAGVGRPPGLDRRHVLRGHPDDPPGRQEHLVAGRPDGHGQAAFPAAGPAFPRAYLLSGNTDASTPPRARYAAFFPTTNSSTSARTVMRHNRTFRPTSSVAGKMGALDPGM